MRDYSYQDMLKMQEDAAMRVREMKKRAALAMDSDNAQTENVKESSEKQGLLQMLFSDSDAVLILSLIALISTENNDYLTDLALLYILL